MSYINVIMPLVDFIPYINDVVVRNQSVVYIRKRKNANEFYNTKLNMSNYKSVIDCNMENKLLFFICLNNCNDPHASFYNNSVCKEAIEGLGGRMIENEVELISLRLISKQPERKIKKMFNEIRNKLKKDTAIGVGVQSGSYVYPNFFYQKNIAENKVLKFDLNNDSLPIIKAL